MITRPLLCALLQPQLLPTLPSRSALHPPLPPTPALRSRAPLLAAADDEGKFVRHSELNPGCAPLGVLLAGFGEDELEAIAMSIEEVFSGPDGAITHVPIVPLAAGDTRVRLRDVLATLAERDSVLPDSPLRLQAPLVMLSGFNTVQTSAAVRAVGALGLSGGSAAARPMFAAVVPNALDKSLRILVDELEGDHAANGRM